MPIPYQSKSVRPGDGGDLITQFSAEGVNINNYMEKLDWRREYDREVRREGHLYFKPNTSLPLGEQPYPAGAPGNPITLIGTARRPDGTTRTFAATQEEIFIYNSDDSETVYAASGPNTPVYELTGSNTPVYINTVPGTWDTVGTGYSTSGHRWEMVNVAGEVVFNNGYDLPQIYDWDNRRMRPIYELREQGIAFVGTIAEFNGMLVLGDIAEIYDDRFSAWMNGLTPYGPYTDSSTYNRISYRAIWSSIGEPTRYGATVKVTTTNGSSTIVLDYPVSSWSVGDSVTVIAAGTAGAELVANITAISGTSVTLDTAASVSTYTDATLTYTSALTAGGADLQDD